MRNHLRAKALSILTITYFQINLRFLNFEVSTGKGEPKIEKLKIAL